MTTMQTQCFKTEHWSNEDAWEFYLKSCCWPKSEYLDLWIHPVNRLFERSRKPKVPLPIYGKEVGPENLLLERDKVNKAVSDEKSGNGPSNWLKLKSMLRSMEYFDEKSGKIPLILLRERFKSCNLEFDKFQNQLGIVFEIPVFEISRFTKLVWFRSHWGKEWPKLQDERNMSYNWKVGA